LVQKQKTEKNINEGARFVATADMVKAFLEKEMPTATDGEVKNFTD
jgi:formylmethanofuran dehydrogenase subunit B